MNIKTLTHRITNKYRFSNFEINSLFYTNISLLLILLFLNVVRMTNFFQSRILYIKQILLENYKLKASIFIQNVLKNYRKYNHNDQFNQRSHNCVFKHLVLLWNSQKVLFLFNFYLILPD